MSNFYRFFPLTLLGLIATPANAGIVDDCFSLSNSQQYAKAETLGRQAVKQVGSFDAHICLGKALLNQGKASEALPIFQTASNLARSDNEIGLAANWLGNVYSNLGNDDAALEQHNRDLSIAKRQNNKSAEATALNNVALVYDRKGDTKRALQYYEEALRIQTDQAEKTTVLNNIALLYNKDGDSKKALSKLEEAIAIDRRLGNHHSLGQHLLNVGSIRRNTGDLLGAHRDIDEGLTYVRQVGDKAWMAGGLTTLALLREDQGELALARQAWEQAARNYKLIKDDENARWAEQKGQRLSSAQGCDELREAGKAALAQNIAEAALKKSGKDASAWLCLGKLQHGSQSYSDATKSFAQVARFSSLATLQAIALDWAGWSYRFDNDLANARRSSLHALKLAREIKSDTTETSALENLISIELDDPKGDKRKLAEYCMQLDVMENVSVENGWIWQSCGNHSWAADDFSVASRRYEKAINSYQSKKESLNEATARIYFGHIQLQLSESLRAQQEAEIGLNLLSHITPTPLGPQEMAGWKRYAFFTLGEAAKQLNKRDEARKYFQVGLEAAQIEGNQGEIDSFVTKLSELEAPTAQIVSESTTVESAEIQPANEPHSVNLQQKLIEGLGKLFGKNK